MDRSWTKNISEELTLRPKWWKEAKDETFENATWKIKDWKLRSNQLDGYLAMKTCHDQLHSKLKNRRPDDPKIQRREYWKTRRSKDMKIRSSEVKEHRQADQMELKILSTSIFLASPHGEVRHKKEVDDTDIDNTNW